MNKIEFTKIRYSKFTSGFPSSYIDGIDKNHCAICDKYLKNDDYGWFVYYVGRICEAQECATIILLQYSEYLI